MNVLIVESPSKAKSINKYLGSSFKVLASVGHVRDLSAKNDAIDTENDFQMQWETSDRGKKVIKEITDAAKKSENLYLATDPDREGEAIASHLASEVPSEKLERVEFNEITKAGVKEGMNNSRKLDHNMINAQKTRRIIDRLVGYKVSPVLWATLQKNMNFVNTTLSAGRVPVSYTHLRAHET